MDPENVGTEALVRVTHWLRGIWEMRRRAGPVQQWVDSIPSYGNTSSSFTKNPTELGQTTDSQASDSVKETSFVEQKLCQESKMTASAPISIPNSPAIITTGPTSSIPHNRLVRDLSLQSDSSHCSSVESLLEWRKADPEAILLSLGFGYNSSPQENGTMSRIPKRFLQPSKLKGIAINDFLKQQQESSESLDSASLGYRGLTGSPYVAPSEIVQKIMERLREYESHEYNDSYNITNNNNELFAPMQQDGRLSVLSPDNRQYLERPRSKSPDMRNKRMIIGEKSFAFGFNGDLIEIESLNEKEKSSEEDPSNLKYNSNDTNAKLDANLRKEENIATRNEISMKRSEKKLTKQLSFDEDNSRNTSCTTDGEEELTSFDRGVSEEQGNSLVTVISRQSDSDSTTGSTNQSIEQHHFDDMKSNLMSRRASDGFFDLKSKRNMTSLEERRFSDSTIHTRYQRQCNDNGLTGKKRILDKKPELKRQANISDVDPIDIEGVVNCDNSATLSSHLDGINDYVFKHTNPGDKQNNDIECDVSDNFTSKMIKSQKVYDSRTNITWKNVDICNVDNKTNLKSNHEEAKDRKLCCPEKKHRCCKNDELAQICEHEETSTDCCCHVSSTHCWRKLSKIMRKNQKLEDMVAKSRQEMAELREMLNSVMSVRMEPGY